MPVLIRRPAGTVRSCGDGYQRFGPVPACQCPGIVLVCMRFGDSSRGNPSVGGPPDEAARSSAAALAGWAFTTFGHRERLSNRAQR